MDLCLHLVPSCRRDSDVQFKQLVDFLPDDIRTLPSYQRKALFTLVVFFLKEALEFRVLLPDVMVHLLAAAFLLLTPFVLQKESLEMLASGLLCQYSVCLHGSQIQP